MPEGPELHIAARMVNRHSTGRLFTGPVVKSEVSTKNPNVEWDETLYTITASSRGKEVRLILTAVGGSPTFKKAKKCKSKMNNECEKTMDIVFRFGMSGKFTFEHITKMPKHAHLNFYTKEDDMVLSFTDFRRFGRWEPNGDWGKERGPCVILEYEKFRENVLNNLHKAAFNKPICEALLNQKFFNGIGNYLRAEILYRLSIPPFTEAREVLTSLAENKEVKSEEPDLLQLCNLLPLEVLNLGDGTSTGYDPEADNKDYNAFNKWLQCYYKTGMKNMVDHNSRTIWFDGPAGPMTPAAQKSRGKRKSGGSKATTKDKQSTPAKKQKTSQPDGKEVKTSKAQSRKPTRKTSNNCNSNTPGFSPKKTRSRVAAMKDTATKSSRKKKGK